MAAGSEWKDDSDLKFQLESLVKKGYERSEILHVMQKDFPQYTWGCIKTLDRRLRHFNVRYIKYETPVEDVRNAVRKEMEGPGRLLGVRAMTRKLRVVHDIQVPRDVVNAAMYNLDPDALEERQPCTRDKRKRGQFVTRGVNWTWSLDGHNKLMGFENWTFPLGVYGCYDTASRKVMFLKVWTSNSSPLLVGRWYFDHIFETKKIPSIIRLDRGTETGVLASIQAFLRRNHEDMAPEDTVQYGTSTTNRIKRWWRELHERLKAFFKSQLLNLLDLALYDREDENDRNMLAYVYIPLIQREMDTFAELWNSSRCRLQKNTLMPDEIPDFIYSNPEAYGLADQAWEISLDELETVARVSGVLNAENDYRTEDFRRKCSQILPNPENILPKDAAASYRVLRRGMQRNLFI